MPLPVPKKKGEVQKDFISRCMSNPTMKKEFPNSTQRVAVCNSQWRKAKGIKEPKEKQSMETKKRLRLDIAQGIQESETRVDREKGIIYGFAVVEKGILKDKRGEFNDEGLEIVAGLGNESNIGIKSRYGHPNMSNTALGTFLGRVKNFRKDEDVIRGDLHFDKTAYKTPNGDLASYVMGLAESDPDAFGASMVIECDFVKQLEEDGTAKKDEKGEKLVPLMMVTQLKTVDIVDDGAATSGMLGNFFSDGVKPSAEMTNFLDKFLDNPEAVKKTMSFLERYANNTNKLARGEGQGVDGPKQGDGGADNCVCPKCNYKAKHERGTPCNEMKCPKCGANMVGESANNTKKLDKKNNISYIINSQNLKKGGDTVDTIEALEVQIAALTAEKTTLADELAVKKDAEKQEELKAQIAALEEKIGDAEVLKTTITDLEVKLGDAEGKVTKLESDKLSLAKQERDNKIDSYLEKAKKEGRILPAWEASLKSLLTSLNCEAEDFAIRDKDDKEIKVTQEMLLMSVFDNMPKIVDFKEKVIDGDDIKSDAKIDNKENLEVTNEDLAAKAEKYAMEHKVSYEDALIEVDKQS